MSEQRWLKVPAAAVYPGVSRDTIYTACERGELRHARLGRTKSDSFERHALCCELWRLMSAIGDAKAATGPR